MEEEWRPVVGYDGLYEVSDLGHVRSVKNGQTKHRGITLSQPCNPGGYHQVTLKRDRRGKTLMVHQCVAHAFLGVQESRVEIRHLNGDKDDNRLVNLAYGSRSDNVKDMVRHGTHRFGKSHCVNGHPFSPENTYQYATHRVCKICHRAAQERHKAKRLAG